MIILTVKVNVSAELSLLGTFSTETTILIEDKHKNYYYDIDKLNLTDYGAQICDYARLRFEIISPQMQETTNGIKITPACLKLHIFGGNCFGTNRDKNYYIPTKLYCVNKSN